MAQKSRYSMMLEPYRLPNGVLLKNRLESPPSGLHFLQGPEAFPNQAAITNYINRAKGGAAIVSVSGPTPTPGVPKDQLVVGHFNSWDATDKQVQNVIAQLVDGIHCYNSKALIRVDMDRLIGEWDVSDNIPTAFVEGDFSMPVCDRKAAPIEVMEEAAERFSDWIRDSKNYMGFDGVWLHMSYRHAFLGRCLSPLTNKRTDKYGGSLENRARYPLYVASLIKRKCGGRFIVEGSVSGHDFGEGGTTLDDVCKFAKMAEGLFDILVLKAPFIDEAHPIQFHEETPWLYMTEALKKSAPNVAISASGGYFYPDTCEAALREGNADMIAMARSFISNPDYGVKLEEGRTDDLTPCLRCNKCHVSSLSDPWLSVCSVNPLIGMEHMIDQIVKPPAKPLKIAVIGGGPAGMKAAVVAAERGHGVTLYEKSGSLGGQLNVTSGVDFKWTLQRFKAHLIYQVKKHGIEVLLNRAPTVEELEAQGYDVVLAAVGADPVVLPIPGAGGKNVVTALDAFEMPEGLPENIVVIGGGEVGTELGIYLARLGRRVTILEMTDALARDSTPIHYRKMFRETWENCEGLEFVLNATAESIDEKGVAYRTADGQKHFVPADGVVMAAGMKPREEEALKYVNAGKRFYMIGDCQKVGNIQKTMRSAYMGASRF